LTIFIECALFVAGLVFGSFLNVCITRIPRDESVVRPRSHCRTCGATIRWWHNVPVLSFLLLRGRCHDCDAPIPFRYPAVELLTAVVFAACYQWFGPTWTTLKFCVFGFLLIGLIFMDAETGLLPHEFTYPGIVLGLAFAWIAPVDAGGTWLLLTVFHKHIESIRLLSLLDATIGALVGAGFFYLTWALYWLVRKRHGLGFGDIALIAMTGAFLGLKLNLVVIFCGPILTVIYVIGLLAYEAIRPRQEAAATSHPASAASNQVAAVPDEVHSRALAGKAVASSADAHTRSGSEATAQAPQPGETEDESTVEPPFLQRELPFGVFLGISALLTIFLGEAAWAWYLGSFHKSVLGSLQGLRVPRSFAMFE
jgi:leader peptidase (prepilin peptidase)/N-methyltransferase